MRSGTLSPAARRSAIAAMSGTGRLDVLVVGGGVVGAGCALDAVTRGLSVGLVEMRDWASGTSSRTSKLIHGGLRYLEMMDFALVREALRERGLLHQRLAPHLVRPVPFLYPLRHRIWERVYAGAGVLLYDTMASSRRGTRGLPRHRHLSRRSALAASPSLRADSLVGALQYYDAQVDDARYTMFLVRTAAAYGAHAASRARVVGFLRDGDRVTGARVHDLEHDRTFEVRAREVINATGVWTDETQDMVGERGTKVRAAKGVHLVVPRDRIRSSTGIILRTAQSVLLVIPWDDHWIIGTTDTDWLLDKAHPAASGTDIDYLLGEVNRILVDPLTRDDVVSVYAGLRPLLAGESDLTSKLSREHTIARPVPGLVVVAGGKYTTYRVMARHAVDTAVEGLGATGPASCTERVPLLGAEGFVALANQRHALAERAGLPPARVEHLLRRYGALVSDLIELIDVVPRLGDPIEGADAYLYVEVAYAVTHEGARHLEDVLTRRTRIYLETADRGTAAAPRVAEVMAGLLGWTGEQVQREVKHYLMQVDAERASQEQPGDATADALRLGAPDVVPLADR